MRQNVAPPGASHAAGRSETVDHAFPCETVVCCCSQAPSLPEPPSVVLFVERTSFQDQLVETDPRSTFSSLALGLPTDVSSPLLAGWSREGRSTAQGARAPQHRAESLPAVRPPASRTVHHLACTFQPQVVDRSGHEGADGGSKCEPQARWRCALEINWLVTLADALRQVRAPSVHQARHVQVPSSASKGAI